MKKDRKIDLSPFLKGLKVDDAVILGKQKEQIIEEYSQDEGA